ncbi:hypothetical protein LXT21_13125 [Myxococcus sp. K38C18041901]|uniref:hypothetical protein n=1 Tax=Myxococcus guangdongensis TaxID=2906760 RepID=UPI0020A6FA6D|nr:hypothetical protein [Myxococcus guangdongensis]MCP3059722.1 hypothetical protein [Myxococcus guangdongensis]
MRTTQGSWLPLALALTTLLVGCGSGLEEGGKKTPQDSDGDGVVDAQDCAPTDRQRWREQWAYEDTDRDGWGHGPGQKVCASNSLPPGWSPLEGDCAPTDASAWRNATGLYPDSDVDGATGPGPVSACVGDLLLRYREQPGPPDCDDQDGRYQASTVVYADVDGDGVGDGAAPLDVCAGKPLPKGHASLSGDCAPDDPLRSASRTYLYRDQDLDGTGVESFGQLCLGRDEPLPAGYLDAWLPADCDDTDATKFWMSGVFADTDGDGVGAGPMLLRCMGNTPAAGHAFSSNDCAPEDATRWRQLDYAYRDADGDGDTVSSPGKVCAGQELPPGYLTLARGSDCDDQDATVRVRWDLYRDADGDGVGAGPRVSVCASTTRPSGYATSGEDCADDDATRWQWLSYAYRDVDGDRYTVAAPGQLCAGEALPAGYLNLSVGPDCDDTNASVHKTLRTWPDLDGDGVGAGVAADQCTNGQTPANRSLLGSDCADDDASRWVSHAYQHVDRDEDGFTTPESGTLCAAATLPAPYFIKATGNDCDDADAALIRWAVLYPDNDGDGVGTEPRRILCIGTTVPPGLSIFGDDTNDNDPSTVTDPEHEELETFILDL